MNHNRFLGYTKDEKGQLIIEVDEAEVVKRIFREYLEGASLQQIGRGLEADGILTGAGKKKWRAETLQKILKNEKYIGDALLQKTYTVDFLEKKHVPNNGLVPQYYVENSHEAIIPRDLYMQVQEEMVRRANLRSGQNRKKRVYSSKYALCIVPNAGTSTAGVYGITEESDLSCGAAVPGWNTVREPAMPMLSMKQNYKTLWFEPLTWHLVKKIPCTMSCSEM